jgi:hypothetical protein
MFRCNENLYSCCIFRAIHRSRVRYRDVGPDYHARDLSHASLQVYMSSLIHTKRFLTAYRRKLAWEFLIHQDSRVTCHARLEAMDHSTKLDGSTNSSNIFRSVHTPAAEMSVKYTYSLGNTADGKTPPHLKLFHSCT